MHKLETPSFSPNATATSPTKPGSNHYRFAFFLFSIEARSLICLSRRLCFFFCMTLFELPISACPSSPITNRLTAQPS